MAIACLRLFTVLPLLPLLSVPRFFLCIARSTSFEGDFEYFRAVVISFYLLQRTADRLTRELEVGID
jgi:hypothetical protein